MPIDRFEQFFNRGTVRRVLAPMREKDAAFAIDKKIPAGLIVVVWAVVLQPVAFAQESEVEPHCRWRENAQQRQALQGKSLIGNALWIGEYDEGPAMMFLVRRQFLRLGK